MGMTEELSPSLEEERRNQSLQTQTTLECKVLEFHRLADSCYFFFLVLITARSSYRRIYPNNKN